MKSLAAFKKDYIVGLDIGSSSVKMVKFMKKGDGLHLVKAEVKEGGADYKTLLKNVDVKGSKVIVSINCPRTAVKVATVPYMPRAELYKGIMLQAKNYFPFSIDDAALDFEILGDVVEKGVRKHEVVIAVSPKSTIHKYLELLQKAGIRPASFVPGFYALAKWAGSLNLKEDEARCFVDIGRHHTELLIIKGASLVFTRKIPVAGHDFTKAMTGVLVSDRGKTQLSVDEAEKIKQEVGIPPEGESRMIGDNISTTQILSMLRSPLEQLVNEIDRCFDYYREATGSSKIDAVVLSGAGASLGGLVKFLSQELDVEVKLADPLEGLKVEPGAVADRANVSHQLGLAIAAAMSEAKGINLLPAEIQEQTKTAVKRGTIVAVATAVVLVLALVYIGMRIQLVNFNRRIAAARLECSSLQTQVEGVRSHHLANSVLKDEPHWDDVFKELSNIIPEGFYLTGFSVNDNTITMKGIVASEDGERVISDFVLPLERGIFQNVKLVRTEALPGKTGHGFELRCEAE